MSLSTKIDIPEQEETDIKVPLGALARSVFAGSVGGSVVAWIPGVSPTIAAITARLGSPSSAEEFLISIAGVNTANALFSLVALYVIGKPRSGAAAAIRQLMALDQNILTQMMIMITVVSAASYVAAIASARAAAKVISQLNYRWLCLGVLAFLTAMTIAFAGLFGLFIFFLSTVVGLVAPVAGIRRTHAMGVLMLPLIVHFL